MMDRRKSAYHKAVGKWRLVSWLMPVAMIAGVVAGLVSERYRTACIVVVLAAYAVYKRFMRPKPALRDYPEDFAHYEKSWEPDPEPEPEPEPHADSYDHDYEYDYSGNPYDIRNYMR